MASSQVVIFPSAGIQAGVPFTLSTFLLVTNVSPPTAASGNISQTGAGDIIIGPLGDPNAAATEDIRMQGGAIIEGPARATGTIDTVSIGRAQVWPATGVGDDAIAIGRGVVIGALAAGVVVIGALAEGEGTSVVIGQGSKVSTLASTSRCTIINSTGSTHATAVGLVMINLDTNVVAAQGGVFIGNTLAGNVGADSVGINASINEDGIGIGRGTTTEVNGSNGIAIGFAARAGGPTTATDWTNNIAIGSNAIAGGSGVAGQTDSIAIGQAASATGTTTQAAVAIGRAATATAGQCVIGSLTRPFDFRVFTHATDGIGFEADGSVVADDTRILVFDVTGAALKRVSRGAIDSGGVGFRVLRIPN